LVKNATICFNFLNFLIKVTGQNTVKSFFSGRGDNRCRF